jgi:alpha/beta superfamily hydrolase
MTSLEFRAPFWAALVTAAALAVSLCLPLVGCGTATVSTSPSAASHTSGAATSKTVHFTTEDAIDLGGHVFGSGQAGVILCHMYPADQSSWHATAQKLAAQGYLVLTFDFRGYGESGGKKDIGKIDRDVVAAISEIRTQGAASVVLVGASMGGTASLVAGEKAQAMSSIRLAGVATLSAPVEFMGLSARSAVPSMVVPLLFIAAEGDAGAAGAQQLEQLSSGKGDLQILPGSDHGTALLNGAESGAAYQLLLDFVEGCSKAP